MESNPREAADLMRAGDAAVRTAQVLDDLKNGTASNRWHPLSRSRKPSLPRWLKLSAANRDQAGRRAGDHSREQRRERTASAGGKGGAQAAR